MNFTVKFCSTLIDGSCDEYALYRTVIGTVAIPLFLRYGAVQFASYV